MSENMLVQVKHDNSNYIVNPDFTPYPEVISYNEKNPTLSTPYCMMDLEFYLTRETAKDVDYYRDFIKNVERRFRSSRYYKGYKAVVMETLGIDRCQEFGNIRADDATVEMHHNILTLFDVCILISGHVLNTVGWLSSYQLIQLLKIEHENHRIAITFLTKTAHQIYHHNDEKYIKPEMTFGKWWELLSMYRYGVTYDIAKKIITYVTKYQNNAPISISIQLQEQLLSYASYNEYGTPVQDIGYLPYEKDDVDIESYGF